MHQALSSTSSTSTPTGSTDPPNRPLPPPLSLNITKQITNIFCPICSTFHLPDLSPTDREDAREEANYPPKQPYKKKAKGAFKNRAVGRGILMHFFNCHRLFVPEGLAIRVIKDDDAVNDNDNEDSELSDELKQKLTQQINKWFTSGAYKYGTNASGVVKDKEFIDGNEDKEDGYLYSISSLFTSSSSSTSTRLKQWNLYIDFLLASIEDTITSINQSPLILEKAETKYIESLNRIHDIARVGSVRDMEDHLKESEKLFYAKQKKLKSKIAAEEEDQGKHGEKNLELSKHMLKIITQRDRNGSPCINWAGGRPPEPPSIEKGAIVVDCDSDTLNDTGNGGIGGSKEESEAVIMVRLIQTHTKFHRDVISNHDNNSSNTNTNTSDEISVEPSINDTTDFTAIESEKRENRAGKSVLHFASRYANVGVIDEILSPPSDSRDNYCASTSSAGDDGNVAVDFYEGMHVDLRTDDGTTPVMLACYAPESGCSAADDIEQLQNITINIDQDQDLAAVKLLVFYKADLNLKNKWGCTVCHWAGLGGNLSIVKFLRSKKVSFTAVQKGGHTPIHKMAIKGHFKCIEYIHSVMSKEERTFAGDSDECDMKPSDILWRNFRGVKVGVGGMVDWMVERGW